MPNLIFPFLLCIWQIRIWLNVAPSAEHSMQ